VVLGLELVPVLVPVLELVRHKLMMSMMLKSKD